MHGEHVETCWESHMMGTVINWRQEASMSHFKEPQWIECNGEVSGHDKTLEFLVIVTVLCTFLDLTADNQSKEGKDKLTAGFRDSRWLNERQSSQTSDQS